MMDKLELDFESSRAVLRGSGRVISPAAALTQQPQQLPPLRSPSVLRRVASADSLPPGVPLSETDVRIEVELEQEGSSFETYFALHVVPEWLHSSVQFGAVSALIDSALRDRPGAAPSVAAHALDEEAERVETFFRELKASFVERHMGLVTKLHRVAQLPHPHDLTPRDSHLRARLAEARQFHQARDALRTAISEYSIGLVVLQKKYCALNKLALLSLIARYERGARHVGAPSILPLVARLFDGREFAQPSLPDAAQLQEEFARTFYRGGEKTAVDIFQPHALVRPFRVTTFFLGLCVGFMVCNVVLIVYLICTTSSVLALPDWQSQYLIFRGALLVLLMLAIQALNMMVWKEKRVNYRYICEIGHESHSHFEVFRVVAPLGAVTTLLFTLYLFTARGDIVIGMPAKWFGFIEFVLLLLVTCFPFDWLIRSARSWVLLHVLRFFCAPFLDVRFPDFYVGDQLCSMLVWIYDLEFSFCFIFHDVWFSNSRVCETTAPTARLCLAGVPYLFRFLQCVRRYRDTRSWRYLLNMGKFGSALAVVVVNGIGKGLGVVTVTSGQPFPPMSIAFIAVSSISYLAFLSWDIVLDWGLLRRNHRLLRADLMFPRAVYYAAMPLNAVLRLAWILTVSPGAFGITLQNDLLTLCLAVAEECRRGLVWNFLRMENEATNNVSNYRAVLEVPVPFADDALTEEHPEFLRQHMPADELEALRQAVGGATSSVTHEHAW